jgi:hypothetical protein
MLTGYHRFGPVFLRFPKNANRSRSRLVPRAPNNRTGPDFQTLKPVHIGFLMPMTILNLASLIIVLISIARAKRDCHEFDPTDPRSLVSAESILDESDHSGWADSVSYRERGV